MLFSQAAKRQFYKQCEAVRHGRLVVISPNKNRHEFGEGADVAELEIHDWNFLARVQSRGDIGFGEAYIEGMWSSSDLEKLLRLLIRNRDALSDFERPNFFNRMIFQFANRVLNANTMKGASKNIKAHYDVGNEFYQLWLDDSMTYSSAIFDGENDLDLASAQDRKYDRILDRLGSEGDRVLEIGCGWGGFAERAADQGRHVEGITLSPSQKGYADARLDGRANIKLRDYRAQTGKFDHIVSIEMVEAIGQKNWPSYFQTIKNSLNETGKAVIQAITVPDHNLDGYIERSDFIRQYTFPGGLLLSPKAIGDEAKKAGLQVSDEFAFGQDYGKTCRIWSQNFENVRPKIMKLGYDEAFLRNWKYYLELCAAGFSEATTSVYQMELQHA